MPRVYQPKLLPDGTPNPKHKPRPKHWKNTSGKSGKRIAPRVYTNEKRNPQSKFFSAEFIALDGEGGEYNHVHQYQMLAASTGELIYKESGLSTVSCFEYLLELLAKHPKAIYCIFAGSYDANLWLRDIPKETIIDIVDAEGQGWTYWNGYAIRYVPRKQFCLKRDGVKESITVWDVHGFFQGSFVSAVKSWLPEYDKLDLIVKGKQLRTAFTGSDYEFMVEYNNAELEALVLIMNKFREGLQNMNLTLSRWDGAGAVAMAMYKIHDVKSHYQELPDSVQTGAQHAYFGGRIEIGKVGREQKTIHHYDINSAYPAVQVDLPSLAQGEWKHYESVKNPNLTDIITRKILAGKMQKLTLCLIKWGDIDNTPFCPFPYRSHRQKKVLFPSDGYNWLWLPELEAAVTVHNEHAKYSHWEIDILEVWEFFPATNEKPFGWIQADYNERQNLIAESKRTGIPNGQEKNIKLGLNSLYGKTAQRVGYDPEKGRIPPYHSMAYAGYITATTRAKLWHAAMQSPFDIIALATDGIYSLSPLTLDCPKEKVLGKWEYQTHDEMTIVQAGFYFYREGEKWVSFSRGFDKMREQNDIIEMHQKILDAWAKHKAEVYLPCTRFITLKSALISDSWWGKWCTWHKSVTPDGIEGRQLKIMPFGTKREITDKRTRADKYMLQTMPTHNFTPDELSLKHDLPWDDEENVIDGMNNNIITDEHDIDSQ